MSFVLGRPADIFLSILSPLDERHRYVQDIVGHEVVLRLIELDGVAYLSSGNVGALPFTPLMGRPAGVGVESWLGRCVAATEGLEVSRAVKHSSRAWWTR